MFKWLIAPFLLIIIVSCKEEDTISAKDASESIPNEIRIYADTIGWDGKLACTIMHGGKEYLASIKYRGGISSKYPKHSMTLEMKEDVELCGLPANDDWILNASFVDKTFQRHKLSYDIFRAMHPDNVAARCAYVPVYHNDNYIGLYVLMEKINGSLLGFDKNRPQGARLYKDPFVFVEERLPNVQEPDNYYQQKFPKQSRVDFNHEPEEFKRFLFDSDDSTFIAFYKMWVVERNLIDWHLLLLLTNNDDGVIKNFYLFRDMEESNYQFIPWDYDHSFGRDGNYDLNLIDREVGWAKSILLKRLVDLNESGYATKLNQRYRELRKELFTERELLRMIDENDAMLRPYLDANQQKWVNDAEWYSDGNDYFEEIDIIKRYIPLRLEQLDNFFSTLEHGQEEKN